MREEANRIHRILFKRDCGEDTLSLYKQALPEMLLRYDELEIKKTDAVMAGTKNWEALEFSARLFGHFPILSDKFKLMVYIAETDPINYEHLVNRQDQYLKAWLVLSWQGILSGCRLLVGIWLLWRIGRGDT